LGGALALAAALLAPPVASAQVPALTERGVWAADTLPGLWREGGNPAGLAGAGLPGIGRFTAALGGESGALRRPQDAEGRRALRFGVEGDRARPGAATAGRLVYGREAARAVRWSAVADPYAGSPYIWADSAGGDWTRDRVEIQGAAATLTPLAPLTVGLRLDYAVAQGARQNDPRPLFRRRDLRLTPGVALRLAEHHTIGAHLALGRGREENEVGYFADRDPYLFRLRGYGLYDVTQLVQGERTVLDHELGGGLQYAGERGRWRWSAALDAAVAVDSAVEGVASPRFGGRYRREGAGLGLALRRRGVGRVAEARFEARVLEGRGTDPVFLAQNTTDAERSAVLRLSGWRERGAGERPLEASLDLGVHTLEREDIATRTRWDITTLGITSALGARRPRAGGGALLAAARAGYGAALRSHFEALRPTALTPILTEPEFRYHAADRFHLSLALGGERPLGARTTARLLVRGSTERAPELPGREGRHTLDISLEMIR
jgi:hypothetical protein